VMAQMVKKTSYKPIPVHHCGQLKEVPEDEVPQILAE